jgi:hypothetical protein
MGLGAQNMKTRPNALGTVENGSEIAKHEKLDPMLSVQPKKTQNMKTIHDALGTAESRSGREKHEN